MSLGEGHRVVPPRHCDIHSHHTGWSQSSSLRKQTQLQECLLSCYCIWTFDTHSVTTLEVSETQNTPTDEHSTNLKASSFVTEWFKSHRMELGKPSGGEAQCSWFWANQATAGEDGDEESEGTDSILLGISFRIVYLCQCYCAIVNYLSWVPGSIESTHVLRM